MLRASAGAKRIILGLCKPAKKLRTVNVYKNKIGDGIRQIQKYYLNFKENPVLIFKIGVNDILWKTPTHTEREGEREGVHIPRTCLTSFAVMFFLIGISSQIAI